MGEEDLEIREFLSKKNCRGCGNHCQLTNPYCGRSRIFIKEATEEFYIKNNDYRFTIDMSQ